jgi:uncharacterized membrane protein YwzB
VFGLLTLEGLGEVILVKLGVVIKRRLLTVFQTSTLTYLAIEFVTTYTSTMKTNTRSTTPLKPVDHHPQLGLTTRHSTQDGRKVCVFFLGLLLGSTTSFYFVNQAGAEHTTIAASFIKSNDPGFFLRQLLSAK